MAIRRCEPEPRKSYFDLVRQICLIDEQTNAQHHYQGRPYASGSSFESKKLNQPCRNCVTLKLRYTPTISLLVALGYRFCALFHLLLRVRQVWFQSESLGKFRRGLIALALL
jgi:hypothetical protein